MSMSSSNYGLDDAVSELDDGYLRVLLLISVRRASSEEPRRAAFWHALANVLGVEQAKRTGAAEFQHEAPAALSPGDVSEVTAVLEEMRRDVETLEAEYREAFGDLAGPAAAR